MRNHNLLIRNCDLGNSFSHNLPSLVKHDCFLFQIISSIFFLLRRLFWDFEFVILDLFGNIFDGENATEQNLFGLLKVILMIFGIIWWGLRFGQIGKFDWEPLAESGLKFVQAVDVDFNVFDVVDSQGGLVGFLIGENFGNGLLR